jgi:hypothetical protein
VQQGTYCKWGREVVAKGRLLLGTLGTFGSGNLALGGLPVPAANLFCAGTMHVGNYSALSGPIASLSGYVSLGSSFAQIMYTAAGGGVTMFGAPPSLLTATTDIQFSLAYTAAS